MILDGLLQFTGASGGVGNNDAATDSPTTGTQTSSNILDLHLVGLPVLANGQGARDLGIGDDPALKLSVIVNTTFTGGTSLQVNFQGAPDNGSGAPGSFSTFASSPVVAEANLVQGAQLLLIDVPRPPQGSPMPRFLQLQYVSVGTHGAGKLRGNIVLDRVDQVYNASANQTLGGYPAGITVAN